MTLPNLPDLTLAWEHWNNSSLAAKWKRDNPGEWAKLSAYRGNTGPRPTLATATGRQMVCETAAWLLAKDTPPADEWPTANKTVSTEAQWNALVIKPFDSILVTAAFFQQVNVHAQTPEPAYLDFRQAVFHGDIRRDLNACWVRAKNLKIRGGTLSNPAGHGLLFHESTDVQWHGFKVDGVGGTCLRVFTVNGHSDRLDLQGEVSRCGGDLTLDPHAEKGTGLHPSYIGGGDPAAPWYVRDSRFDIHAHDCATGSNQIGPKAIGCDFTYRAERLAFRAKQQTAGNAVQLFGAVSDVDISVEADDVAQVVRATDPGLRNIRVNHGRGTNVRGNYDSSAKYMPHPGITYTDCT